MMVMTAAKWYVLHTQTGVEAKVKASLESRAEIAGLRHLIHQIHLARRMEGPLEA